MPTTKCIPKKKTTCDDMFAAIVLCSGRTVKIKSFHGETPIKDIWDWFDCVTPSAEASMTMLTITKESDV
jgi:hypothetical protein